VAKHVFMRGLTPQRLTRLKEVACCEGLSKWGVFTRHGHANRYCVTWSKQFEWLLYSGLVVVVNGVGKRRRHAYLTSKGKRLLEVIRKIEELSKQ